MARAAALCVIAFLLVQAASAAAQADSVLALTGNARAKLVWVRWPWCDESYQPIQEYRGWGGGMENIDPFTRLLAFDTDEGTARVLDSTIGSHCFPRLTRKDGSHVIWIDRQDSCSWIRDFAGTEARRKLASGQNCFAVACRYDPADSTEWVYVLSKDYRSLTRYLLTPDYTLDLQNSATIHIDSLAFEWAISVSQDGVHIGCMLPWPECSILDAVTSQIYPRRAAGEFGCNPNIAPDNTCRFFHLRDNHRVVRMWGAGLDTANWDVVINAGLPGTAADHDCVAPRWSNSARFFTVSYPLTTGFVGEWGKNDLMEMTADQVMAADPAHAGSFCLGRFDDEFRTVASYVRISDGDIRHRDVAGDAWIEDSAGSDAKLSGRENSPLQFRIACRNSDHDFAVEASLRPGVDITLAVYTTDGRLLARARGSGIVRCAFASAGRRIFMVMATDGRRTNITRTVLKLN